MCRYLSAVFELFWLPLYSSVGRHNHNQKPQDRERRCHFRTRFDYPPLFGKGARARESGGNRAYFCTGLAGKQFWSNTMQLLHVNFYFSGAKTIHLQ